MESVDSDSLDVDIELEDVAVLLGLLSGDDADDLTSYSAADRLALREQAPCLFGRGLPVAWWAMSTVGRIATDRVVGGVLALAEELNRRNVATKKRGPLPFSFSPSEDGSSLLCAAAYPGTPCGELTLQATTKGAQVYRAMPIAGADPAVLAIEAPPVDGKFCLELHWQPGGAPDAAATGLKPWEQPRGPGKSAKVGTRESKKDDRLGNVRSKRGLGC
mmetsp:Transcript_45310/g.117619  ORF Transcript_45310/g.117619 Transcript_45310/m.117619 type:complete len:218 (+) Transcript_45310:2-655(+)